VIKLTSANKAASKNEGHDKFGHHERN